MNMASAWFLQSLKLVTMTSTPISLQPISNEAIILGTQSIGETGRRKTVQTGEHGEKDAESWVFKHSSIKKHPRVKDSDFEVSKQPLTATGESKS